MRVDVGGYIYHTLNRASARATLFEQPAERRAAELDALRTAAQRGRPFGAQPWRDDLARRFALGSTLRSRGRPKHEKVPDTFSSVFHLSLIRFPFPPAS